MRTVFTYGTLQIPEVFLAVTGKSFTHEPAVLDDYVRFRIRHEVFPGVIPQTGRRVEGVVYYNVDQSTMEYLDAFEDILYRRQTLPVLVSANRKVKAEVYVVSEKYRYLLTDIEWNTASFRKQHLSAYLGFCKRFYRLFSDEYRHG